MSQGPRIPLEVAIKRGQFVVTTAILLTCGLGFLINDYIHSKQNEIKTVESTAHVLTQNLTSAIVFQDQKEATKSLGSIKNHPVLKTGTIYDLKGHVFASFPPDEPVTATQPKIVSSGSYAFPILSQGEPVGSLILTVRNEIDYASLLTYLLIGTLVLAVGFMVALLIARLATTKISGEITSLLQVIRKISQTGNSSYSVLRESESKIQIEEIFGLSLEFDSMLVMIEKRNNKIEEINQGLEQTIERRTDELKQAHAGLLQSSKLSALGEMAAGLAHEINNPLAVISGKSQQISSMIARNRLDLPALAKHAVGIESMAERISKIIKGLKSFSRDGTEDPFVDCKLKSIIDDALELCQSRFKSHGVALEVSEFDPEITIACRATQLGQVFLNLLNNAHDAVLQLDKKWVKVSVEEEEHSYVFSVMDSGSGIPEVVRQKMMQPFFTTKEVGKGTGLGLSISKGIIEGHAGSLSIDAQCGNTKFVVRLPKSQVSAQPQKMAS